MAFSTFDAWYTAWCAYVEAAENDVGEPTDTDEYEAGLEFDLGGEG